MIIKKAQYKKVKKIVNQRISEDIYGCDCCKKEFKDEDKLEITVFFNNTEEAISHQFCSWKCLIKYLPEIKTDYFISLPFLHYDTKTEGTMVKDFINLFNQNTKWKTEN